MPELEKELKKAHTEWSILTKERTTWVVNSKKARKMEAHLDEMEKAMAQLQSIHKNKLEWNNAICKGERERVAKEL